MYISTVIIRETTHIFCPTRKVDACQEESTTQKEWYEKNLFYINSHCCEELNDCCIPFEHAKSVDPKFKFSFGNKYIISIRKLLGQELFSFRRYSGSSSWWDLG